MITRWFQPDHEGWNPRLYEWWFTANPLTASIRAREERAVFGALEPSLRPHHSLLEVGPGSGNYTLALAQRCRDVVAADCSTEMLDYLSRRVKAEKLRNVELRKARLPHRLSEGRRFDAALSVGVLNYVRDLEGCLRSLAACVKPGGRAVFTVPFRSPEGQAYRLSELVVRRRVWLRSRIETLEAAGRAGLKTVSTQVAGITGFGLTLVVCAAVDLTSAETRTDALGATAASEGLVSA